jgi:hypothetical protein
MKVRDRRIIFLFVIKLLCRKINRRPRRAVHILSFQVVFRLSRLAVSHVLLQLSPTSICSSLKVRIVFIIIGINTKLHKTKMLTYSCYHGVRHAARHVVLRSPWPHL